MLGNESLLYAYTIQSVARDIDEYAHRSGREVLNTKDLDAKSAAEASSLALRDGINPATDFQVPPIDVTFDPEGLP